ncbi:MAG: dihydropyrimidinase [Candidatus Ozemobacteraceae bacterium]
MYDLVFKDALIKDGFTSWEGDLAIQGEKIAAVGCGLSGKREVSVEGKWLIPGALDVHTHFSLPFAEAVSSDDFFTGTRAAAFGGVTTIIDFTAQNGEEGIRPGFQRRLALAEGKAVIDYGFHACMSRFTPEMERDLEWACGAGLTSLKVFTAYRKAGMMLNDGEIYTVLRRCRDLEMLTTFHAESGDVIERLIVEQAAGGRCDMLAHSASRPVFTETEAVRRVADLAEAAHASAYIVHLSCGNSTVRIAEARRRGVSILAETCPQYLFLDDSQFSGNNGHLFGSCPPIRPAGQEQGLWRGLEEGHIQVVATDHCPFMRAGKDTWHGDFRNLPMGLPGIETLVPLILSESQRRTGSVDFAIRALSVNPAKIFGLYPRKGCLLPGSDADIVIYDPARTWTIAADKLHMNTDFSPYEGMPLTGKPIMTISRGDVLVEEDLFKGASGRGRFLVRSKPDLQSFLSRTLPLET